MALYLGEHKVNLIKHEISYVQVPSGEQIPELIDSSNSVTITKSQWETLEDATKKRTGTYNTEPFTINDINNELQESYGVTFNQNLELGNDTSTWTRPNDWPNLDSLNLTFSGADDFIYMTYRVGHIDDFLAFNIYTVSGTVTINLGHISNGSYIVDQTFTSGSTSGANFYRALNNTNGYNTEGYTVVKIAGKIKYFYLIDATYSNLGISSETRTYKAQLQHMLERIAYVPNIINFYTSSKFWGTHDLEREKIGNNTGTACTSVQTMYYRCVNLQNLDVSAFYTPNITNMQETFRECIRLKELNINHWTVNKVTTLYLTFYYCLSLQNLNISTWTFNNLTSLAQTFQECRSLQSIDGLENFDTKNVTNMVSLFSGCRSLNNIYNEIKNWNTDKVTRMDSIFNNCHKITNLDLSTWNISKISRTDYMFQGCISLKNIYFPSGKTSNLTTIYCMFSNCVSLQNVDVSWLKMDAGTCTMMGYLFNNCRMLREINIPTNWNLTGLTNSSYAYYQLFYNCTSLEKITGISNWNLSTPTNQSAYGVFTNCYCLKDLDISGWQIRATNYGSFFSGCYSLTNINISGFDTSLCTTFNSMFYCCYSLKSIIGPSTWDTSKVTNMASMFNSCMSLQNININFTTWDMSKVTTIDSMFANCSNLKTLNINNWNLAACTTITSICRYDYSLEEISWSGWSLPKLTTTAPATILEQCYKLKKMTGFPPIKLAFNMRDTWSFPVEELVELFTNLQDLTGSTARTINLRNQQINRLSATEKAIATGKNWTLAD